VPIDRFPWVKDCKCVGGAMDLIYHASDCPVSSRYKKEGSV